MISSRLLRSGLVAAAAAALVPIAASATSVPPSVPTSNADTGATPASTVPAAPGAVDPLSVIFDAAGQSLSAPSRMEMFADIKGLGAELDGDRPLLTVTLDGAEFAVDYDLALLFAAAGIDVPADLDSSVHAILSGGYAYVSAPLIAQIAPALGSDEPPMDVLAEIGDGWARISLSDGGEAVEMPDPASLIPFLAQGAGDMVTSVTELGTEDLRGVTVTGYGIEVPVDEMTLTVEVWVGDDGLIHRVLVPITAEQFAGITGSTEMAAGGDDDAAAEPVTTDPSATDPAATKPAETVSGAEGGADELAFVLRIEWIDHGAADIDVIAPAEYVDITDDLGLLDMVDDMAATSPVAIPSPTMATAPATTTA